MSIKNKIKKILRNNWKTLLGIVTISLTNSIMNNSSGWWKLITAIIFWFSILTFFEWREWVENK